MSKELGFRTELRQGQFHILWYCKTYGDVLKDQPLRRTESGREAGPDADVQG